MYAYLAAHGTPDLRQRHGLDKVPENAPVDISDLIHLCSEYTVREKRKKNGKRKKMEKNALVDISDLIHLC